MNFVLEGFIITYAYDYYGYQPWRWGSDLPLWWIFTNYGELLGAAVLVLAASRLGPRAYPLAIVVVPGSFAAWELWTGWPMFAVLNSDANALIANLAALGTAAIAVGTIYALGRFGLHRQSAGLASPVPVSSQNAEVAV
jgi:hypothetical protein